MKRQAAVGASYIAIDGCIFDGRRKLIFSSSGGDGTITVIREAKPGKYVVAKTIRPR
jgi:hypothetical protein